MPLTLTKWQITKNWLVTRPGSKIEGSWLSFAIWSLATHFLYSFQGVFVASVYFLFDDKVCNPFRWNLPSIISMSNFNTLLKSFYVPGFTTDLSKHLDKICLNGYKNLHFPLFFRIQSLMLWVSRYAF